MDLQAVLDERAGVDLRGMFGPQLLELTRDLLLAQNKIAAQLARVVREAEVTRAPEVDGLRSMKSWLIGHGRLSAATAERIVTAGRALPHLPAVAAGFASGAITADQVREIAPIASEAAVAAASAQGVDLAAFDHDIAALAGVAPVEDVHGVVAAYRAALDPDGPEPEPTAQRSLTLSAYGTEGMLAIRGQLDAIGGEKLRTALESINQANRPAGDTRTSTQRLADALVQLADNALASGGLPELRRHKPQVGVIIPLEDLLDPGEVPGAGTTTFGVRLSAARVRALACDGGITRIVFGPDGAPLDLGRDHRIVTPALRRAVVLRDRRCVFAGCTAPQHWCEVHHLVHWVFGGETNLPNSALLCEAHHTQVHHGFRVLRDEAGRWHTYRPDDTEILIGVDPGEQPLARTESRTLLRV